MQPDAKELNKMACFICDITKLRVCGLGCGLCDTCAGDRKEDDNAE